MNLETEIKNLYDKYMRNKIFEIAHHRDLSKIVRLAKADDTPFAKNLLFAWERTATGKTCKDSMRA